MSGTAARWNAKACADDPSATAAPAQESETQTAQPPPANVQWGPCKAADTPGDIANLLQATAIKLPKAVQLAREKVALAGFEQITPQALMSALSKAELNKLGNINRAAMHPPTKAKYEALKTDSDRKSWLAHYVVDPTTATCSGYMRVEAFNTKINRGTEQWMHESEIAGPKGLNCPRLAKILCQSNTLPDQPSEYAALAAAGEKQYLFDRSNYVKDTGAKEVNGAVANTELQADEFKEVAASLSVAMTQCGSGALSKKRAAPKEPESAEKNSAGNASRRSRLASGS